LKYLLIERTMLGRMLTRRAHEDAKNRSQADGEKGRLLKMLDSTRIFWHIGKTRLSTICFYSLRKIQTLVVREQALAAPPRIQDMPKHGWLFCFTEGKLAQQGLQRHLSVLHSIASMASALAKAQRIMTRDMRNYQRISQCLNKKISDFLCSLHAASTTIAAQQAPKVPTSAFGRQRSCTHPTTATEHPPSIYPPITHQYLVNNTLHQDLPASISWSTYSLPLHKNSTTGLQWKEDRPPLHHHLDH
jgi:hypothetical protein